MSLLARFILLIILLAVGTPASAAEPYGTWLTGDGDARIRVDRCGSNLCGTIVWLKKPIDPATGKPQVDDKNPNPALAKRPVIGLPLFSGMRATGPGKWSGQIYNADDGSTYASSDYRKALDARGIECSMSRKGDCWDNAVAESFFATLKTELIYRRNWPARLELRAAVFEYIEVFYNRRRLHSSIGYNSPADVESALGKHPAVHECAVFGVDDRKWGEAVHAAVELNPGHSVGEQELIGHVKMLLDSVKAPKRIHIVAQLPRSAVGKVLRREAKIMALLDLDDIPRQA